MSDTQTMTKKEKQKAADEKRRAMRKDAAAKLMEIGKKVLDLAILDEADAFALKTALFNLRPLRNSEPTARQTVQAMLKALFADKKSVSGADAYAAFRAGTISSPDLRKYLVLAIKTGKPEDRLWIEYNGKEDEYVLVGTGAEAPFGWTGYVPADAASTTGDVPQA